jgi:hypothetical protein
VIAYISSCAITVLVSIIAYIVHWLEDRAKREVAREETEETEETEERAKPPWSKRIWMNTRSYLLSSELWKRFFERLILAWSDQQLLMGVLWLIAGAGLPLSRGHIRVSVFIMVINLAWFAGTTHIITIFVLRDSEYFMDPRHSVLSTRVRLVSMIIFGVILIGSTCVITRPGFAFFNCPASCVLLGSDPTSGFNASATIRTSTASDGPSWGEIIAAPLFPVSLGVLIVSYLAAIGPMFSTRRSFDRVLSALPPRCADWITDTGGFSMAIMNSLGSALLKVVAVVDLYLFVFDTYQTFSNIAATQNLMDDQEENNKFNIWRFGQVIPLLFFIFPLVQAFKTYKGNITRFFFHVANLYMIEEKAEPQEENHGAIELLD